MEGAAEPDVDGERGDPKNTREACRYPYTTDAGRLWLRVYNEERAALDLAQARAAYNKAISESACIN